MFTGLRTDDDALAEAALAELTPLIRAAPIAYNMLHAYLAASEFHLDALTRRPDRASVAAARPYVRQLERYARQFEIGAAHAAIHRARLLAAGGAHDRKIHRTLQHALATAQHLGLPHSEAEARLGLATLLSNTTQRQRRGQLLAASDIFRQLGAAWDLARVEALLM